MQLSLTKEKNHNITYFSYYEKIFKFYFTCYFLCSCNVQSYARYAKKRVAVIRKPCYVAECNRIPVLEKKMFQLCESFAKINNEKEIDQEELDKINANFNVIECELSRYSLGDTVTGAYYVRFAKLDKIFEEIQRKINAEKIRLISKVEDNNAQTGMKVFKIELRRVRGKEYQEEDAGAMRIFTKIKNKIQNKTATSIDFMMLKYLTHSSSMYVRRESIALTEIRKIQKN